MTNAESSSYDVTLIGVAPSRRGRLSILATFTPKGCGPEEIQSVVIDYDPAAKDGEVAHAHEGWLTAMAVTKGGKVAAVSADGELVRFSGRAFTTKKLVNDAALNHIALLSNGGYVAVGDGGCLLYARTLAARPKMRTFGSDLYAVDSVATGAIVAAGSDGCVLTSDGVDWQQRHAHSKGCLFAVAMRQAQQYFLGGEGGLWRVDHEDITKIALPRASTVYDLVFCGGRLYVAAGKAGLLALDRSGSVSKLAHDEVHALQRLGSTLVAMGNNVLLMRERGRWLRDQFDF